MPLSGDLRPSPRFQVTVFVGQGEEQQPLGRTRDVSASGMFLETADRPPIDSFIAIAIVWGDETFDCQARVVRHADDGVGLTFVEPNEAFQHALAEIIGAAEV